MAEMVKFSPVCGQNIILTNSYSTAMWDLKNSGGHIFSDRPICQGQAVKVLLQGSGHCTVGYTTEDPNKLNRIHTKPTDLKTCKFHKQESYLQISVSEDGKEGILHWTRDNDGINEERFKMQQRAPIWLALNLKFGTIAVKILPLGLTENLVRFSQNHGSNVYMENDNTQAKSVTSSPASICFLTDQITVGEELVLNCSPLQENGRIPSRYHLNLYMYENDPACLKDNFKYLFDASQRQVCQRPGIKLKLFEKEECNGSVTISMISPSLISCRAATNDYNQKNIQRSTSCGIWIILELFRISVIAKKNLASESNKDVLDGIIHEPSNVYAENTMRPIFFDENTNLKRVVGLEESSYARVSKCQDSNEPDETSFGGRIAVLEREQSELREGVESIKHMLQKGALSTMTIPSATMERTINARKNFTTLVRDIDCMPLLDKLYERQVITLVDYDGIEQLTNRTERNRAILRLLHQKNVKKTEMDEILDSVGQGHLKVCF